MTFGVFEIIYFGLTLKAQDIGRFSWWMCCKNEIRTKVLSSKINNLDGGFWRYFQKPGMSINGFPIQILLSKSKEERTEVISRLLSLLLHTNYKNIWSFLNIFILVPQLWCHEFRKHSFNNSSFVKKSTVLLKAYKHQTF